jgi:hypothetical protein
MSQFNIIRLTDDTAVRFAAIELKRYLAAATGSTGRVLSRKRHKVTSDTIWLGLAEDLPATGMIGVDGIDEGEDAFAISIDTDGGYIAGTNGRSILIGVYRYLQELGFRWLRPGSDGEIIPSLSSPFRIIDLSETASYGHRGVCIEGAVSYENVRDMVAWLPKIGFNAYFIQFRDSYNFFQRWYEHVGNPHIAGRPYSMDRAKEMTAGLRAEIKKRGLDLHMVGHGWTCEPFGIPGAGWYEHEGPVPEEAVPFLAKTDGERKLWGNIALNTNLCYGNPETRRIIVESIVEYAGENSDVDILHFWLADGSNNHCECPLCAEHRPADLYVQMLNELNTAMEQADLETRIVFLVYVDLLWPPAHERIENPDRFLLMFAPITRSYSTAFAAGTTSVDELPPYVKNKVEFPSDPGVNSAFLKSWEGSFKGDGFDFDYHLMWDHFKDPGQVTSSRVLHEDIRRLRDLGLNGLVSCQVQRVFFPTALSMVTMGRTLWDANLNFDDIMRDHLSDSFGKSGEEVGAFLAQMSELFDPPLLRGEKDDNARKAAPEALARVREATTAMRPHVVSGIQDQVPAVRKSWEYLAAYLDLCELLADALSANYAQADDARDKAWEVIHWARAHERELQPVMDLFEFQHTIGGILGLSGEDLGVRN